jgi:CheY-like chemotaxis protein
MKVHETGLSAARNITGIGSVAKVDEKAKVVAFGANGKLKVLVADDVPDDVHGLVRVLRQNGHEVDVVSRQSDVTAMKLKGVFDLVISDLAMPLPDMGIAVMRYAMREGIPTIAHTSSDPEEIHPDVRDGLHGIIVKTSDRAALAARLSAILHPASVAQQE